jgi:hypothetical protein
VTRQEKPDASGPHGSPRTVESKASVGFLAALQRAAGHNRKPMPGCAES